MAYLTRPTERLYCRFEHYGRSTVKMRNALVQYCVEISKNPFFDVFLAHNVIFFYLKLPFLFLAHLASASGQISCVYGRHRRTTVILWIGLVRYCVKMLKNPFF